MKLGESIATHRRAVGLTQVQLADVTGISRNHLQRIEAGHRDSVQLITLARIASAVHVTPSKLLEGVDIASAPQLALWTVRSFEVKP